VIPLPSLSDNIAPIREALDAASHDQCVNWMRSLGRKELRALYELAAGKGEVSLSDLHGPEDDEVIVHLGQNSLPLFSTFQKRFCRRGDVVQGYNHNPDHLTWFTGPGHFTCVQEGAEVLIDYEVLPPDVPSAFPALIDNDSGTRSLVFGKLKDRLRRVSSTCTVGRAYKGDKPMSAWFMLVRQGTAADTTV
jgi:hypothetical protein